MKSIVEPLSPTRVKVLAEVPAEVVAPHLKQAYRSIAEQVAIPGFRRGKVPAALIDQRFGRGTVLQEAINDALPEVWSTIVDSNDLHPLMQPEVEITDLSPDGSFKFTAEVDVRPTIELPEYTALAVTVDAITVDDAAVEEQLTNLRKRFGSLAPAEKAAEAGDFCVIDLSASQNGEPMADAAATGLTYEVGSGDMIDGLDDALLGLSAGDTRTFQTQLMGSMEGVVADVTVTVTGVKVQTLPEANDEFAQEASEFDTIGELRASIADRVERSARLEQAMKARTVILEALRDSVEVPLPEGVLKARTEEHFEDGHGDDEHRAAYEKETAETLKVQLILDEIVRAEKIGVNQEELTEYLVASAYQAGQNPNDFIRQVAEAGNIAAVAADVARGKALGVVVAAAVVTDTNGNVVDLENLQEDGTYAEADAAEVAEVQVQDVAAVEESSNEE